MTSSVAYAGHWLVLRNALAAHARSDADLDCRRPFRSLLWRSVAITGMGPLKCTASHARASIIPLRAYVGEYERIFARSLSMIVHRFEPGMQVQVANFQPRERTAFRCPSLAIGNFDAAKPLSGTWIDFVMKGGSWAGDAGNLFLD
jgi:hypothetical protein